MAIPKKVTKKRVPNKPSKTLVNPEEESVVVKFKVKARNSNQQNYLDIISQNDVTFGLGPSGTGKSFIAVAKACEALANKSVKKIILVRPAVEAGEKLGFLPGSLQEKVDPYMIPLYDALDEILGPEKVKKLIDNNTIEIAPISFMRGRTMSNAFIIMDEAQNTTYKQLKMFLTRFGHNSKVVITGDESQVDLPNHIDSGLSIFIDLLQDKPGFGIHYFDANDIVRHPLVTQIVIACDNWESFEDKS